MIVFSDIKRCQLPDFTQFFQEAKKLTNAGAKRTKTSNSAQTRACNSTALQDFVYRGHKWSSSISICSHRSLDRLLSAYESAPRSTAQVNLLSSPTFACLFTTFLTIFWTLSSPGPNSQVSHRVSLQTLNFHHGNCEEPVDPTTDRSPDRSKIAWMQESLHNWRE